MLGGRRAAFPHGEQPALRQQGARLQRECRPERLAERLALLEQVGQHEQRQGAGRRRRVRGDVREERLGVRGEHVVVRLRKVRGNRRGGAHVVRGRVVRKRGGRVLAHRGAERLQGCGRCAARARGVLHERSDGRGKLGRRGGRQQVREQRLAPDARVKLRRTRQDGVQQEPHLHLVLAHRDALGAREARAHRVEHACGPERAEKHLAAALVHLLEERLRRVAQGADERLAHERVVRLHAPGVDRVEQLAQRERALRLLGALQAEEERGIRRRARRLTLCRGGEHRADARPGGVAARVHRGVKHVRHALPRRGEHADSCRVRRVVLRRGKQLLDRALLERRGHRVGGEQGVEQLSGRRIWERVGERGEQLREEWRQVVVLRRAQHQRAQRRDAQQVRERVGGEQALRLAGVRGARAERKAARDTRACGLRVVRRGGARHVLQHTAHRGGTQGERGRGGAQHHEGADARLLVAARPVQHVQGGGQQHGEHRLRVRAAAGSGAAVTHVGEAELHERRGPEADVAAAARGVAELLCHARGHARVRDPAQQVHISAECVYQGACRERRAGLLHGNKEACLGHLLQMQQLQHAHKLWRQVQRQERTQHHARRELVHAEAANEPLEALGHTARAEHGAHQVEELGHGRVDLAIRRRGQREPVGAHAVVAKQELGAAPLR